jgi:hypothetical protein
MHLDRKVQLVRVFAAGCRKGNSAPIVIDAAGVPDLERQQIAQMAFTTILTAQSVGRTTPIAYLIGGIYCNARWPFVCCVSCSGAPSALAVGVGTSLCPNKLHGGAIKMTGLFIPSPERSTEGWQAIVIVRDVAPPLPRDREPRWI